MSGKPGKKNKRKQGNAQQVNSTSGQSPGTPKEGRAAATQKAKEGLLQILKTTPTDVPLIQSPLLSDL